jgi:transcriptional regulator with XRE-family HTH domain
MRKGGVSPIGIAIRAAREMAGWSFRELAEKAEIDHASIFNIETGKTGEISFSKVAAIAGALGLSIDALMNTEIKECPTCEGRGWITTKERE